MAVVKSQVVGAVGDGRNLRVLQHRLGRRMLRL